MRSQHILLILPLLFLIVESQSSKCPRYWFDASYWKLGCLSFNATQKMTWHEAQDFCMSMNSHLIEIFIQEQQDFIVMKSLEIQDLLGKQIMHWWTGLTKIGSEEGIWYWAHSLQIADYFAWGVEEPNQIPVQSDYVNLDSFLDYGWSDCPIDGDLYLTYPICQFFPN